MAGDNLKEINLEAAIEESLLTEGGYERGDAKAFNAVNALDEQTLLKFIQTSQPKAWKKYTLIYPANPDQCFIDRVCKVIRERGLLDVLRKGFKDRGIEFKLMFKRPTNTLNPDLITQYNQNILQCMRQVHHSVSRPNDSVDIMLLLNGIPVVSMELKNQFTGQDVTNAIDQYKFDRSGADAAFEFKRRVLVHFAVDLYNVFMTTKLNGAKTFFLPFNQGSNGAGNVGGRGNPANMNGFTTDYLWKNILQRDRLLEIIEKYIHLEVTRDKKTKKITKETMIFPRYHQLDVVTKLIEDVQKNGSGHSYLIQHSAGSGKSNSIAWLTHRLSSLADAESNRIFNSVIVLTDRRVLDGQLRDTISQFDHVEGTLEAITEGSAQLKEAINDGKHIIISTLQKFPYIYNELQKTDKKFAVIIDEAHSSQSGKAASTVIAGLGDTEAALAEQAAIEAQAEGDVTDGYDELDKVLAGQGQHDNLSFFAFTATPKAKTLNRFGTKQPDGKYVPFHVYSMRQAIEEGFILDVLRNYTTYSTYYKLMKNIPDDPQMETSKGAKAVRKFQTLHPHNIAQKTQIMIEHFRDVTKNKIDGRAKAMVVSSSRLQALKYYQAFKKYIAEHGYTDVDVLIAFSGELTVDGQKYTEEGLNIAKDGKTRIKEKQLPEYFKQDFNVLIVADKYQTGFDEPLLHTMFVDKKLNDVKAVQTLSRLNRTTAGKTDTFVLDFVNTAEDIQKSFQQYYQATFLTEEVDPNELYKLQAVLDGKAVYTPQEVENFASIFFADKQNKTDLGKLSSILKPAQDRFVALDQQQKDEFRSVLNNFIRMYSFVAQIVRLFDRDLQKFYVFASFLIKVLRNEKTENPKLDDKLVLEYYKLVKTHEGDIALKQEDGGTVPPKGGTATTKKEKAPLSAIIDKFNERFGTDFSGVDKVLEQVMDVLSKDAMLSEAAKTDNRTLFDGLMPERFNKAMIDRYNQNDRFFKEIFSDEEKLEFLKHLLFEEAYRSMSAKKKK